MSLDYYRLFFHEAAGRKIWLRVGKFLFEKSPQSPHHLSFFVQLEVYLENFTEADRILFQTRKFVDFNPLVLQGPHKFLVPQTSSLKASQAEAT